MRLGGYNAAMIAHTTRTPARIPWRASGAGMLCSALGHAAVLICLSVLLVARHAVVSRVSLSAQLVDSEELATQFEVDNSPPFVASSGASAFEYALPTQSETISVDVSQPFELTSATVGEGEIGPGGLGDLATEFENLAESLPQGDASFYGVAATGKSFVFVVDVSGSMEGKRFGRARNELRRSIQALARDKEYFVVLFNHRAIPMPSQGLLASNSENLRATKKWLHDVVCGGDTDPQDALQIAIDLEPDAIFLLSDGQFQIELDEKRGTYPDKRQIPIHTIGFVNRVGEPTLKSIAKRTGGMYRFVP